MNILPAIIEEEEETEAARRVRISNLVAEDNRRMLREIFLDIGSMGHNQLTPEDVDALAEQYAEARRFPIHTKFHE